ncbi:hypothetical protein TNCT_710001 [Trichonephila clavata]|uniref:Uncharacterized protein n=1 Tax=Trichonephila clavata TaxID=2740835 RepID=A0A8X6FWI8_TRICU|nr:hypothetical protein TNCT_710001 [Trichonephila clavata]
MLLHPPPSRNATTAEDAANLLEASQRLRYGFTAVDVKALLGPPPSHNTTTAVDAANCEEASHRCHIWKKKS